ncbi:MAG: hypothetical protein KAW02_05945, partial [candidate division Zixibacteria bacterium]|nr:hypothetical protein [candidate division Zixibacteria bacterium]
MIVLSISLAFLSFRIIEIIVGIPPPAGWLSASEFGQGQVPNHMVQEQALPYVKLLYKKQSSNTFFLHITILLPDDKKLPFYFGLISRSIL